MKPTPLVSVICLCYNQKKYVVDAINSVINQTYQNIELIIVDDGSTDGSQEEIRSAIKGLEINFIAIGENVGNCKAFNIGFSASSGNYIIDLAADDMLLPLRVEIGINDFVSANKKAGVHFTDAFNTNEEGRILNTHYERDQSGQISQSVPIGNIYSDLIQYYFISPTTMMTKRSVLEELSGYDENLKYEDFDFWVRSSRRYNYIFNKAPLVKKRIIESSHSKSQRQFFNSHQSSTFLVCQKVFDLNKTSDEYLSLIKRCKYEIRQCLLTLNFKLIPKYIELMKKSKAAYRRLSSPSNIDM